MAELERTSVAEAKLRAKKKLAPKIVSKVDTKVEDVLQWAQEGRELVFEADEEFLELSPEAYKALSLKSKTRYDIAKSHTMGNNPVSDAIPEAFNLPFNQRPDEANRQLAVFGKDPKKDYHWGRIDKLSRHQAEGWEVDHDPNVHTEYKESCNYKTLGGQKSPEAVLLSRPKEISEKKRAERKAIRDGQVKKTQNAYRASVESVGVKPIIGSDNG